MSSVISKAPRNGPIEEIAADDVDEREDISQEEMIEATKPSTASKRRSQVFAGAVDTSPSPRLPPGMVQAIARISGKVQALASREPCRLRHRPAPARREDHDPRLACAPS